MTRVRRLDAAVWIRLFLGVFLIATAKPALAAGKNQQGQYGKTDASVRRSVRGGARTVPVIISISDESLRQQIRQSLQTHGDVIKSEHPLIGAIAADVHVEDVALLAGHPGVRFVSADATVKSGSVDDYSSGGSSGSTGSSYGSGTSGWGSTSSSTSVTLRSILGLPATAGTGPTGRGIGVALIDSGIMPGIDFGFRITGFFDFTKGGVPSMPYDDYGHGTHVAGLIGSNGLLSGFQLQGVAPEVNFVGLKVLDSNGQGSTSNVIKAIEYVVANRQRLGVQIINLSLGHPIFSAAADDPLVQAVERASAAGLIVVASAGNFGQNRTTGLVGYAGLTSPGNAPSAITVGCAMTQGTLARDDDRVADYSSRGPTWFDAFAKPDIVAPGHLLSSDSSASSTLFKLLTASRVKVGFTQFLTLSGTSMATGVTTGVVALVLQANQNAQYRGASPLTPNAVKAILEYSAIPIADATGARYDALTQGAGELNAQGAIALSSAIDTSANADDWWLRNSVAPQTVFGSVVYAWSRNIVWGSNVVWGDVLLHNSTAWSQSVVWGADNVVWGDYAPISASNIVWADAALWIDNIVWGNSVIGMMDGDNIVWGNAFGVDNIVWGNLSDDNIVWGNFFDNVVWGNSIVPGGIF